MGQRGASGFVLGGTNHGGAVPVGGRAHADIVHLSRRTTTEAAMEAAASDDPEPVDCEHYRLHRLGYEQDWVMVWLPEFVKDEDALFYIVDLARGDEWGREAHLAGGAGGSRPALPERTGSEAELQVD